MVFSNKDLIEKFIHSSGHGGQNINKVATCVYLKHIPSGIEVKCQFYRTQAENRRMARKLLEEKLISLQKEKEKVEKSRIEKEKRANRRKPKSIKEQILKEKKFRSEVKQLRRKIEY